jgi:uncharacterized ion transporter superfamily protein YfcC
VSGAQPGLTYSVYLILLILIWKIFVNTYFFRKGSFKAVSHKGFKIFRLLNAAIKYLASENEGLREIMASKMMPI